MTQEIVSHQFDNKLVLVAEPNDSLESAAFTFLVPAGCRFDSLDRAGLAGFTCDMSLRGAGERDSRQFLSGLENLGVERHEGVTNAHASYSGAMLASNLHPALEFYADLLRRPRLPEEELESSRMVVLHELQGIEDEPSQKVMIELRDRHYPDPFGRSSQGTSSGVEAIVQEDILQFCKSRFRPNGSILGVAGRFDWDQLRDRVGELFADWPTEEETELAIGEPSRSVTHIEHDSSQTQIGIAYDSVPYSDDEYYQASGAIGVLSGGMSSRLFTEVREKRGLCYSVYATLHSLQDRGSVLCYAGTSSDRAQETLDVTLAELCRLDQGIEAAELDRLKARIKSGLVMQQESSSARSSSLARDWYHLGLSRTLEEVGRLVDKLSQESINHFLNSHPAKNFTVVTLGPKPLEVSLGVS